MPSRRPRQDGSRHWTAQESFVALLTGSFDNVLGVTIAADTAITWVQAIGWFDLAISAILVAMLVGNLRARGWLYQFAYRLDHSHSTTTPESVGVPGVQPTAR